MAATVKGDVHPAIIKLGLQLREGKIRGANARLIAGLMGLKRVSLLTFEGGREARGFELSLLVLPFLSFELLFQLEQTEH